MQFQDFTPLNITELCPKYSSVIQRKSGAICMGDIQSLQYELEYILTKTVNKLENLENILQNMDNCQEKKEKPIRKNSVESKEKRLSLSEDKPCKKLKDSGGKLQNSPTSGRVKSKNIQLGKSQDFDFTNSPTEIPKVQKSDSSNRFWSLIEPYCAEISQDDIKTLEEWIASYDKNGEYQNIPPLGEHFASKWTREDIQEEMKEGSKSVECPKGLNNAVAEENDEEFLKRVENNLAMDSSHQPLADRLVSCLVEENLMTSLDDIMTDTTTEDTYPSTSSTVKAGTVPNDISPSGVISNEISLEKRLQKEFCGFETETHNACDELCIELKRLQEALIPASDYNLKKKKNLLALAKAEMSRQEIKKKVQEADAKVMEVYRAITVARSKGRKLTKKEQDQAYKMLADREKLIEQLENKN